jgi:hypothetical protein
MSNKTTPAMTYASSVTTNLPRTTTTTATPSNKPKPTVMTKTTPTPNLSKATAPKITHTPITFSTTPLEGSYDGYYVHILDNVFTPEECQSLIQTAEQRSEKGWEQALLGSHTARLSVRNSERILHDDEDMAGLIFERVRPWLEATGTITRTPQEVTPTN